MGWNQHFDGYIDDVRLSREARYTSNFELETIPDTLVDLSSNAHSLTINGDARQIKKGYYFDDTAHMSVADSSDFDFSGGDSFCVELWMNCKSFSSSSAGYAYMCTQSWSNNGFEIGTWQNGRVVIFIGHGAWQLNGSNQGSATMQSSTLLSTDTWHHVALTYDGTTYTLYVDGVSQQTHDGNPPSYGAGNAQLTFGSAREDNVNYTFDGYLTNMRITKGETVYSGNFTPAEILTEGANTKLLLLGDTTDSSSQEHSLTFSGGAASTAKFTNGLQFDGTGNHTGNEQSIEIPTSSDFAFGTDDFTIEFWAYKNADGGEGWDIVLGTASEAAGNTNGWFVEWSNARGFTFYDSTANTHIVTLDTNPLDSTWHHIAIVRNSGTVKLYLDGTEEDSATHNASIQAAHPLKIGSSGNGRNSFNGFIDNVRISKSARYTSNFTAVDEIGVSDKSSGSHSVTLMGDAATSSTEKKFGTHSLYFPADNDYVSIADHSDFHFGANGDFTVECWFKIPDITGFLAQYLWIKHDSGTYAKFAMQLMTNGTLRLLVADTGDSAYAVVAATSGHDPVDDNEWHHCALTRESGTTKIWIDGTERMSTTDSYDPSFSGQNYNIGGLPVNDWFGMANGYVDDFRISNTARYSSNFYLDAGTYISDKSSNSHSMTLSGDASISTAQKKFGDYSVSFDGNGDYLEIPASSDFDFGTDGDFTVEMWVYFNSFGSHNMLANQWSNDSGHTGDWQMFFRNSNNGQLEFFYRSSGSWADKATTTTAVALNTWTHLAIVRSSGTIKFYFNGVADSATCLLYTSPSPRDS